MKIYHPVSSTSQYYLFTIYSGLFIASILTDDSDDFQQEVMPLSSIKNATLALHSFQKQVVEVGAQPITIDRQSQNFLKNVIQIYKRQGFNLKLTPDIDFLNEVGIDGGGLTREFFHMVLTSFRRGAPNIGINLFEGAVDHVVPIHCCSSMDSGLFHLFGKVLAHSIIHGGMGFVGMAKAVAKYIATGSIDEASSLVVLEDIPDLEYRDIAGKVCSLVNCYSR